MEINEKLEVFYGAAIGAANSQSAAILGEQKNIYQSAMEEHEQSCRAALESSRRIFLEKQKKEVNRQGCGADDDLEKRLPGTKRAENQRII